MRNAAPSAPPRPPGGSTRKRGDEPETPLRRLAYTAAGALGTSAAGAFLARYNWRPRTIAGFLTAVGAGFAARGDTATLRSIGAGTMAAAGAALSLMILDKDTPAASAETVAAAAKKPANAGELPPGALEAAFERARRQLAMSEPDYADYVDELA